MKKDSRILVFDNYDSFTYNLVHMIKKLGYNNVEVHRNDKIALADIAQFDKILLSPGPGVPSESGILLELITTYAPTKSIMGVCLGLQAIGEAFGGKLINLPTVFHGVALQASIIEKDILFKDIPASIQVGRYHSWAVAKEGFPDCLRITAVDDEGTIMALAHKEYDVRAVQFHPESVLTPDGEMIMKNWLEN
ncbi:MAG: aminodeoxychorismate/anthranilate synthase component II [Paludibacteraceae bacterium]|jgi:anthranilate synthase component 2|nr:aminodeoxychorismate/anthranilate synthase component II [Paludibacteraceae bacterium]MBP8627118.1 aminodeoxychorismate/anthranilate synthase component II [Paludibacteraceae bacterium]